MLRGFESDLLRAPQCLFIQTESKSLQDSNHMYTPVGSKLDFQPDFTFNACPSIVTLMSFMAWLPHLRVEFPQRGEKPLIAGGEVFVEQER